MALLVEYKCEQTIPKHITIQHKMYQAYTDESNISMQDINTREREIEREQSQTLEICFEVRAPLLYVPAFNTMKDFHENRSHQTTRYRNTYKEFTLELLDSLVPLLAPVRTNTPQARKLAEAAPLHRVLTRTRNNANPQVRLLKYKIELQVI